MKKLLLTVLLFLFSSILLAQKIKFSESKLNTQLDVVLKEGNLLYKYLKSKNVATDSALANPIFNKPYPFWSYFTYKDNEQIKTIITMNNDKVCIAEYVFEDDFTKPKYVKIEKRELSDKENTLIKMQIKINQQIPKPKYGVTFSYNYGCFANFLLVPDGNIYKLYIIIETDEENEEDLIPFGNDYLFIANKKGKIKSWHNFHPEFIPWYPSDDGNKEIEITHNHLKNNPLITATDICTFMLYAPLYDINVLSVYSQALGIYMKYNRIENTITIQPAE